MEIKEELIKWINLEKRYKDLSEEISDISNNIYNKFNILLFYLL